MSYRTKFYQSMRTALSWFALFAFAMGVLARWYEIGSINQVLQAVAFGCIGPARRLTVFRKPVVAPPPSGDGDSDGVAWGSPARQEDRPSWTYQDANTMNASSVSTMIATALTGNRRPFSSTICLRVA